MPVLIYTGARFPNDRCLYKFGEDYYSGPWVDRPADVDHIIDARFVFVPTSDARSVLDDPKAFDVVECQWCGCLDRRVQFVAHLCQRCDERSHATAAAIWDNLGSDAAFILFRVLRTASGFCSLESMARFEDVPEAIKGPTPANYAVSQMILLSDAILERFYDLRKDIDEVEERLGLQSWGRMVPIAESEDGRVVFNDPSGRLVVARRPLRPEERSVRQLPTIGPDVDNERLIEFARESMGVVSGWTISGESST